MKIINEQVREFTVINDISIITNNAFICYLFFINNFSENCGTEPPFSENYYMKKEMAYINALFVIINYLNQSQSSNLERVGQVFLMQ